MTICSIGTCHASAYVNGVCKRHFDWWTKNPFGDFGVVSVCSKEGCSRIVDQERLCATHFKRQVLGVRTSGKPTLFKNVCNVCGKTYTLFYDPDDRICDECRSAAIVESVRASMPKDKWPWKGFERITK